MQMNQPKKNYYITETKRGPVDVLVHNIHFDFNNGWELSLSIGPCSYSRKIYGTDIITQVEAAVFQGDQMMYITQTKDTVIPYLPVHFIQWLCEILEEAGDNGEYETLKDINEVVSLAHGIKEREEDSEEE